jgi:hypothetical protein
VTPALREWYAEADLEELEYSAMTHAARASLHLLAVEENSQPRRLVVAADVSDANVHQMVDVDRAAVQVSSPVPLTKVAAVHVDAPEAAQDVQRALQALPAAAAGDADAIFTVESVEDHELLWYAPQEIADLV